MRVLRRRKDQKEELVERAAASAQRLKATGAAAAEAVRARAGPAAAEARERAEKAASELRERARGAAAALREAGEEGARAGGGAVAAAGGALPDIRFERRGRSIMGTLFNRFSLGFAAGYVLGARAGRERYEQIVGWWDSFVGNPTVQRAARRGREIAAEVTGDGPSAPATSVREVMTAAPATVRASDPLAEAARRMKDVDAGAMVVVDDSERVVGIVTDRDIAVRAVAEGKDPATTPVSAVASRDLATLSPTDSIADAVRLMHEKAIRRLPVTESGKAVGIVSIGDLAEEREPRSVLGRISQAPPNA